MTMNTAELKKQVIELLKRDEEFRYTLAGLIGLREILEELRRLREQFNKLWMKSLEHSGKADDMSKKLLRIELKLKALSESFYRKFLWDDIREEITLKGEKLVSRRHSVYLDDEEIDYLVVTDKSVYVAEVKFKPRHEDVGKLLAKADVVRKHYGSKNIVVILAGALISREVEEYAKQKGVKVYKY